MAFQLRLNKLEQWPYFQLQKLTKCDSINAFFVVIVAVFFY